MTLTARVRYLEDELRHLTAVVDGSEAQTREAVVAIVGLLGAFLAKKGALAYDELIAFLGEAVEPDERDEDHCGRLICDMRRTLVFHRDLDAGTLRHHTPLGNMLQPGEAEAILKCARTQVALERAVASAVVTGRKRKVKRADRHSA